MTAIGAADLLAAWESVRSSPAARRPVAMLRAFARPEPVSVGTRNAALLSLYAEQFGPRLDGLARCPSCATEVELSVPVAELVAGVPEPQRVEPLTIDGHTVHWRLPSDEDLAAVAGCAFADEGARLLVSRCIVRVEPGADPELLSPAAVREALAERIADADPYVDISFTLVCPECATRWESTLDIAEFVWAQARSRARRLLAEVHELARAYGWSEREILALSQNRRDMYLELVRHG